MTVTPIADSTPAPAVAEERPRHSDRQPRPPKPHNREQQPRGEERPREQGQQRQARNERREESRPKQERRPRQEEADNAPASFNDHTPAFLLRPVPQHLIRRKKEAEAV